MKSWLKEVVKKLGDIVLAFEDLVIEWLKKLKSAKVFIGLGILICCFVVVGYTLYMVVMYSDTVAQNKEVVITVFSLTEILAGGVIGWLFKLRADEKINGNGLSNNSFTKTK